MLFDSKFLNIVIVLFCIKHLFLKIIYVTITLKTARIILKIKFQTGLSLNKTPYSPYSVVCHESV